MAPLGFDGLKYVTALLRGFHPAALKRLAIFPGWLARLRLTCCRVYGRSCLSWLPEIIQKLHEIRFRDLVSCVVTTALTQKRDFCRLWWQARFDPAIRISATVLKLCLPVRVTGSASALPVRRIALPLAICP